MYFVIQRFVFGGVCEVYFFKTSDCDVYYTAQLDGIKSKKTKSMKDYLTLDDDDLLLFRDDNIETGKKCVKWADLEEKRKQTKMRAIGFVVGQTDWKRMMDPSDGKDSLTKTKYIERIRHDF